MSEIKDLEGGGKETQVQDHLELYRGPPAFITITIIISVINIPIIAIITIATTITITGSV